jgi:hypothetical protein
MVLLVVVATVMESSEGQWPVASCQRPVRKVRLPGVRELKDGFQPETRMKYKEDEQLVAAEEVRTQASRQVGAIAARAHQAVQPALWQMRIGIFAQHREPSTLLLHYSSKRLRA